MIIPDSIHPDVVFKYNPPDIDHPGYSDWAERMFQQGWDNPYDAYVSMGGNRVLAPALTSVAAGVAAGVLSDGDVTHKVTVGIGVGLIAGALVFLGGELFN